MARCRRTVLLALLLGAVAASPAAAKVAFVSERDGEPELYVMADDGGAQIDVSTDTAAPDVAPSWSPDGTRIVYQRGFGPDADLWVVDADGDGTQRIDTGTTDPSDPAWSPDGRSIAYADDDAQLIHVTGADGNGDHVVGGPGPDALGGDQTPAWTADGSRLLFASLREAARSYDIWSMGLDGGGQQALTSTRDREIDPASGPGGRVFFAGDAPGDYDIYGMAADGSGATRLTTAEGDDTAPAWTSSGAAAPGAGGGGGPAPATPAAPGAGAKKKATPLRVRVSYAASRIRITHDRITARVVYRVNRAATVIVHLYRHGKLRAWFRHRGRPGPNVARWEQRIAAAAHWRGTYTVAVVKASEPTASG